MTLQRILFWLVVLLAEVAVVTVLLSSESIRRAAVAEKGLLVRAFGEELATEIGHATDRTYKDWFYDSGMIRATYVAFIPSREEAERSKSLKDLGKPMFKMVAERLDTFWTAVYYGTQRATILLMWLPFLIPFVIAVIVDGMSTRKKRQFNYQYTSPVIFGSMAHLLLVLLVFPLLYFLAPMPITPYVSPAWIGCFSLALYWLISHTQQLTSN